MFQPIKSIRGRIVSIFFSSGHAYRRVYYYGYIVKLIALAHLMIIFGNILSIVFLVAKTPIYVWLPIISILGSPLLGGSNCYLNRLENRFRMKALMPLIDDRFEDLLVRKKI